MSATHTASPASASRKIGLSLSRTAPLSRYAWDRLCAARGTQLAVPLRVPLQQADAHRPHPHHLRHAPTRHVQHLLQIPVRRQHRAHADTTPTAPPPADPPRAARHTAARCSPPSDTKTARSPTDATRTPTPPQSTTPSITISSDTPSPRAASANRSLEPPGRPTPASASTLIDPSSRSLQQGSAHAPSPPRPAPARATAPTPPPTAHAPPRPSRPSAAGPCASRIVVFSRVIDANES